MLKICEYCLEIEDNVTCMDIFNKNLKKINFHNISQYNIDTEASNFFQMRYQII